MAASALTSRRHPLDRRDRRRLWGVLWALQAVLLAVAVVSLGWEAGLLLGVMEAGLIGSALTALLREPPRPERRR
ncbi:hypothetical protein FBZ83_109174 [Azospirillum brasilense]|uniref:Uncharacterized protein n=1 Tax=Azospirillum brasilense TaxID=192 RepID=A0A560C6B0_AZOBR|nr:hypothetical protein FBZ83_109174 [Azospirillum brasilense]